MAVATALLHQFWKGVIERFKRSPTAVQKVASPSV